MDGTVEFPPRSPDLTPLDFFLWGYLKNIIYQVEPTTPEDMKRRIMETLQQLGTATLQRVENSFRNRVNLCIEAKHLNIYWSNLICTISALHTHTHTHTMLPNLSMIYSLVSPFFRTTTKFEIFGTSAT